MMKKIMMICAALMLSAGVYAGSGVRQNSVIPPVHRPVMAQGFHRPATRVVIAPSLGYYWGSPFYGPYYGFGYPYYYPYFGNYRQSALTSEITSIKESYKLQIKEARRDKTVPRPERKANIANLRSERDQAIINAQKDYYNQRFNNNRSNQSGSNDNRSQNGSVNNDQ